jgi:fumarylacetoacetate (FAA) hydrolase
MKLASLKSAGRDGQLLVVDRQLKHAVLAEEVAPTLQQALDDWSVAAPALEALYERLNRGDCKSAFELDVTQLHSPLPRAYQWADGSAYVNHVELVRKARGAQMPENFWHDPLMYQGGSDAFIGPCDPIAVSSEQFGIDFEAEIAVIVDDTPMGVSVAEALSYVRLIMLVNDVSLRALIPAEIGKGFGFFHSKPSSSFSPVAITPDELGDVWREGKVHLPLISTLNNERFGAPNAGVDMTFNFAELIAHAAKTRPLCAGTIIGSGTVSNVDRSSGSSCLAEKRMLEMIESGQATTAFMKYGDRIRIEMFDAAGDSLFGAIDQVVSPV